MPPPPSVDIREACGLPASSIYWHFGSKDGVLAAVMERGADRFFAAIPSGGSIGEQLAVLADLQSQRPEFLRILYLLSLERGDDPTVTAVVRRVRDTAIARFSAAVRGQLPADVPPRRAERVVAELHGIRRGADPTSVLLRPPSRARQHRRGAHVLGGCGRPSPPSSRYSWRNM